MIPRVLVENAVADRIEGFFEQPVRDAAIIDRIGNPRRRVRAVDARDVVRGDRAPVNRLRDGVLPPLDSREETLRARAVERGPVMADLNGDRKSTRLNSSHLG